MDEVKIWALEDASTIVELRSRGQMEAEALLEDTLVANPDLLLPGLKLVGRQIPTAGGPLDLLGVDEDGRLSLFELKRGTLTREAVAQVIDYAADLETRDPADLADLLTRESGRHGIERIEDFEEWYGQQFGEQESTTLRPLRIFLVGLGADDRAKRMVEYGVTELFGAARDMFRENWPSARMKPGNSGLAIKLRKHVYARIEVQAPGEVQIAFQPRAKALCLDEFRRPVAEIRRGTWPRDRDPLGDANAAIHFRLSVEDWETHKETLTRLAGAVHEAHQAGEAE